MNWQLLREIGRILSYMLILWLAMLLVILNGLAVVFGLIASLVKFPNWENYCLVTFILIYFRPETRSLKTYLITSVEKKS
ncbi:MAG: hypothetical protein WCG01_01605 [bacterium]